ncbi:MAG: aminomethyl-transferring glycine dehydrogenase subunit GcvPA [Carnobacterium sp.]|nr:aminomethyl-transferring glycine dehydrogenase subunit GcvPA [Carnobacterium sp.]
MLATLAVSSLSELFADIPDHLQLKEPLAIPAALHEFALEKKLRKMANKNKDSKEYVFFLGAGTYDHYIPSTVDHVLSRSEFYTAYTPYQAEASQGELQALFEFQTMICELTGMDAANSSLYDGFTALGEAATLAVRSTKRKNIIVSKGVHPQGREVLKTVSVGFNYHVIEVKLAGDTTDLIELKKLIDQETAAVIIQYPNFFGSIEDLTKIKALAELNQALFIVSANPLALALLEAPGNLGADIVVGDTQPLGLSMSYGGPHCGYFAVKKKDIRKIPGRIVGQSLDKEGKRGFVLTLQTREQHIKREKATSNMSSNQALNALASAVFMSALGKKGLRQMAQLNIDKADYMANSLNEKGFSVNNQAPFFNEFVVELPFSIQQTNNVLLEQKIIGGYNLEKEYGLKNHMLVAVTEQRTKEEIDAFIAVLEGMIK